MKFEIQSLIDLNDEIIIAHNHCYWNSVLKFAPEKLNQINYLTGKEILISENYSMVINHDYDEHIRPTSPVSRQDIENKILFAMPDHENCAETIKHVYLRKIPNVLFVDTTTLSNDHWIFNSEIHDIDDLEVTYTAIEPGEIAYFNGYNELAYLCCEKYTLNGKYGEVTIDDESIHVEDESFCRYYPITIIPNKACTSNVLSSFFDYIDEYGDYDQNAYEEDLSDFDEILTNNRETSPGNVIKNILEANSYSFEKLQDQTFTVTFTNDGICVSAV